MTEGDEIRCCLISARALARRSLISEKRLAANSSSLWMVSAQWDQHFRE